MGARVFLGRLDRGYPAPLEAGLAFTGFLSRIKPGQPLFLKPNLTFPEYRPGVMTSPACLEALVILLKGVTDDITIVEADGGGYNKFKMEDVFEGTGLSAMARRLGVKLVNLSRSPYRIVRLACGRKKARVALPRLLLENPGCLISLPVPKVHYLTGVSLSLKNQWGCLPDPHRRLALHPDFDWLIWEIDRVLRPALVVMDGRFALNRNGPLRGRVEATNWLLVAEDTLAADIMACRLMRVDPGGIPHLRHVLGKHEARAGEDIAWNADPRSFSGPRFYLRRELWDYPGYLCFRWPWLNTLAYRSPLADLLHWCLYLFREEFYDYAQARSRYSKAEWAGAGGPDPKEPRGDGSGAD